MLIALAALVERVRRAVMMDLRGLERPLGQQRGERDVLAGRALAQQLADGVAGQLHRAAGHVRLARRRRRARRADVRVGGQHAHVLDAELRAHDLRLDADHALADLRGRGLHLRDHVIPLQGDPHPRRRVVVEALGEARVLDPDGVADAAADALPARRAARPARQRPAGGRERPVAQALEQLGHGRRPADRLARRQPALLGERVAQPQLDRVGVERAGELVHLRLVGEADLHRAEASHGAAGRVVGVDRVGVDQRAGHDVGAARERRGVRAHGAGGRRVGAAVEQYPRAHVDQAALRGRAVLVAQPRGMAMDVAEERLLAPVAHLHRPAGAEREQAGVDLHGDVLARAERAADAGERDPHLVRREPERGRDLVAVGVQPLGGHGELDAAVRARDREPGLRPEERLVLHADLVLAAHDDLRARLGVAVLDPDVADDRARGERALGVRQGLERLELCLDQRRRPARGLGMVGGDDRERLALEPDLAAGEHRLVGDLEAVALDAGHVGVGEHRVDAGRASAPPPCRSRRSAPAGPSRAASRPTACRRPTGRRSRRTRR